MMINASISYNMHLFYVIKIIKILLINFNIFYVSFITHKVEATWIHMNFMI